MTFAPGRGPADGLQVSAYGPAKAILEAGLTFDADGKPHPRHANVIGWDPLEKHVRKQQAVNIACAFRFEMRPAERA